MTLWEAVGWAGNACFFARYFVQWLASERAGRSVAPLVFWRLSLAGAVCLSAYSVHRGEPVLLVGTVLTSVIYLRNLWIGRSDPSSLTRVGPLVAAPVALGALALLFVTGAMQARTGLTASPLWFGCATLGQGIWSSRFVVQWWYSERLGRAHFPPAFWWISLIGSALLLAYATHLADPVYIAGLVAAPIVQIRNLMLGPDGDEPRPETPAGGLTLGGRVKG